MVMLKIIVYVVLADVKTAEEFNLRRQHENTDSSRVALVTSFTDGTPLGHVQLNDFVFGTNPR